MLAKALQGSTAAAQTYVDDVFSTYLYNGNGSTQTITNGIDLAGKGGLVWIKNRNNTKNHYLSDTAQGATKYLSSNNTAQTTTTADTLTAFNGNGFSLGADATTLSVNRSGDIYAAWTFREAPKFFDVVTYTGTGVNRTVSHNLGQVPGMIIVKRTDTTGDWQVYHRSLSGNPETDYLVLNTTAGLVDSNTRWNDTSPTATEFSLGTDANVNANGGTYVAYLFAHDTAADGLIQCGSFTTDGSGNATVNLGWEPQWVMMKASSAASDWRIFDVMRGWNVSTADQILSANLTDAENGTTQGEPTTTGFTRIGAVSTTYIYLAIRRPNKPPTSGTQVFQPTVYTGTNVDNRLVDTTIAPDMVWVRQRDDTVLGGMVVGDRLRGQPYLLTGTAAAEVNDADSFDQQIVSTTEYGTAFSAMNGFWCGNDATAKLNANTTSNNHIAEAFKRAPGFFDVVCYTGTGVARTVSHNLGAIPELILVKSRGGATAWMVYAGQADAYLSLSSSAAAQTSNTDRWNNTQPTSSVFSLGTNTTVNGSATEYVAYLFASLPGISKVGTYTGNGSNQTINCGFSAGARFVLIKRTDNTGDWYVWDTARGIVAGNDPHLSLNSTAAEVTTNDSIDTDSTGFVVNQLAATNINVNSATYIYLAIA